MIQAIIIDDEPNNVEALQQLLVKYCPVVEVIGTAHDVQTGQALIVNTDPDLVFLDIEMPYGNAFDMLNTLTPVNFEIIFVTAFDNYAINAIKYSALDYLLKPVNIRELQGAVQKAADRIKTKNISVILCKGKMSSKYTTEQCAESVPGGNIRGQHHHNVFYDYDGP